MQAGTITLGFGRGSVAAFIVCCVVLSWFSHGSVVVRGFSRGSHVVQSWFYCMLRRINNTLEIQYKSSKH